MSRPVEDDAPARRRKELGEQIEAGGLAGAVRADERVDAAAPDPQVNPAHGNKAGKLLGQVLCFEDRIFTHDYPHAVSFSASSTGR